MLMFWLKIALNGDCDYDCGVFYELMCKWFANIAISVYFIEFKNRKFMFPSKNTHLSYSVEWDHTHEQVDMLNFIKALDIT